MNPSKIVPIAMFYVGVILSAIPSTGTESKANAIEGMVFIKGGCFEMGLPIRSVDSDAAPAHIVCIDDFYIGKYEVTQKQWVEIMVNNPSEYKCKNCPVHDISWEDAKQFIHKLNQKTGKQYRLTTEAEWEYAARSGGKNELWAGTNDESKLEEYVWSKWYLGKLTKTSAKRKPNGLGLYDMTGSVWEWVEDWYDKDYYKNSPKDNPKGPQSGRERVLRGGTWLDEPLYAPTYDRYSMFPDARGASIFIGLRLAVSAK